MTVPTSKSRDPCSYLTMRQATKALEGAFEEALAPTGLSAPQFVILRALSPRPSIPREQLAAIIDCCDAPLRDGVLDLEHRGLVELQGVSSAAPRIHLTPAGRSGYTAAVPMWRDVQRRFDLLFGHVEADALHFVLRDICLVGFSRVAGYNPGEPAMDTAGDMAATG